MPLDRHARRFLEMLAAAGGAKGRYEDVEERRRALTSLAGLVDPPGATPVGGMRDRLMPVDDGAIALRTYSPLGVPVRVLPGILFFHGGGWVAGSLETHDGLCRRLANESGCRVIAVDYRLAPEHPFPFGLHDCFAAFCHVAVRPKDFGIDPARLGVAGDSAGGGLAAALCRLARDMNLAAGGGPAQSPSSCCCARSWMFMAKAMPAANWPMAIFWTAKPCCAIWSCIALAPIVPIRACRRCWPAISAACHLPSFILASSILLAMRGSFTRPSFPRPACRCMAGSIAA